MDVECGVMMDLSDARQTKDLWSRASEPSSCFAPAISHVPRGSHYFEKSSRLPNATCNLFKSLKPPAGGRRKTSAKRSKEMMVE